MGNKTDNGTKRQQQVGWRDSWSPQTQFIIIITMRHFSPKIDFRSTDSDLTRKIPQYSETDWEDTEAQAHPTQYTDVSPQHSRRKGSPNSPNVSSQKTFTKPNSQQIHPENVISSNYMLRNKNTSNERSRQGSPLGNSSSPYRQRATFTSTKLLRSDSKSGIPNYKPSAAKVLNSLRRSFDYDKEVDIPMERTKELSSLELALDKLSSKVFKMKKELEKKNDRHKQQRLTQPRLTIPQHQQQSYHKDEQSSISNEQSVNTVKKSNSSSHNSHRASIKISSLVQSVPKPKEVRGFDSNPYSPRRHNQYYISELVRAVSDRNSLAMEHLCSSMRILKILEDQQLPSYSEVERRKLNLRRGEYYQDKKTLVFDLDETLIHCNDNPEAPSDVVLTIKMDNGQSIEASINIRPYAITLLNHLSKNFEIIVFTASHSCYADVVLDYLDPEHKLIQHRLYREHCYFTSKEMYVKDLRIINRSLHQMVLIDNAAYSYSFQLENGIPILPYYDGSNDFELKALESYLGKVATCKDVRELNKKTFKLHQYQNFHRFDQLVEQLYKNA